MPKKTIESMTETIAFRTTARLKLRLQMMANDKGLSLHELARVQLSRMVDRYENTASTKPKPKAKKKAKR